MHCWLPPPVMMCAMSSLLSAVAGAVGAGPDGVRGTQLNLGMAFHRSHLTIQTSQAWTDACSISGHALFLSSLVSLCLHSSLWRAFISACWAAPRAFCGGQLFRRRPCAFVHGTVPFGGGKRWIIFLPFACSASMRDISFSHKLDSEHLRRTKSKTCVPRNEARLWPATEGPSWDFGRVTTAPLLTIFVW